MILDDDFFQKKTKDISNEVLLEISQHHSYPKYFREVALAEIQRRGLPPSEAAIPLVQTKQTALTGRDISSIYWTNPGLLFGTLLLVLSNLGIGSIIILFSIYSSFQLDINKRKLLWIKFSNFISIAIILFYLLIKIYFKTKQ